MRKYTKLVGVAASLLMASASSQAVVCTSPGGSITLFCGEIGGNAGAVQVTGAPVEARNNFLTAAGSIGTASTENFSSFTQLTQSPVTTGFGSLRGSTTTTDEFGSVTNSHFAVVNSASGGLDSVGRSGTSGESDPAKEWFVDGGVGNFVVEFSSLVSGFGFYGVDIGDFGGFIEIDLFGEDAAFDSNGTLVNSTQAAYSFSIEPGESITDASLLFWGFVDNVAKYKYVRFSFLGADGNPNTDDGMAFDDMTAVFASPPNPAPEPASLALLGAALAAAGLSRRRARRTS